MTVKISNLPAATSVGSGDVLPVVQSGTTKKIDLNSPWSINIDGGNIDGTPIGVSSASSGAFTTLTASGDVNFDSGTLFVDASADAVGIGTTSPDAPLEVQTTTDNSAYIRVGSNNDGSHVAGDDIAALEFYGGDLSGAGAGVKGSIRYQYGSTSGATTHMAFAVADVSGSNDVERMRIDSSGRVGIGTTSPNQQLHSTGNQQFGQNKKISFSDSFSLTTTPKITLTLSSSSFPRIALFIHLMGRDVSSTAKTSTTLLNVIIRGSSVNADIVSSIGGNTVSSVTTSFSGTDLIITLNVAGTGFTSIHGYADIIENQQEVTAINVSA